MALQKSLILPSGITAPMSYTVIIRAVYLKGSAHQGIAQIWASKADRDAGREPLGAPIVFIFEWALTDPVNIITAAYAALKAMPLMAGAVDV